MGRKVQVLSPDPTLAAILSLISLKRSRPSKKSYLVNENMSGEKVVPRTTFAASYIV
jgi:hypothetical protein